MSKHQWYVHLFGENIGPLSTEKVTLMLQQNRLQFVDFIWAKHLTKWQRISDLDQFTALMPNYPKLPIPEDENTEAPAVEVPVKPKAVKKPAVAPVVAAPLPSTPAPAKKVWPKARKFLRALDHGVKVNLAEHGSFSVVNISEGGVFLETEKPLNVGTEVKFQLELPAADKILDMTGVVIRHGDAGGANGFAIEFTRLNPAHKRILGKFLTKQAE